MLLKLTEEQRKIQKAALEEAIKIIGSPKALADSLNKYISEGKELEAQHIRDWKRYGIPICWVIPISKETGVSMSKLNSLLYPKGLIVK